MTFLHLSDLHLGKRVNEVSMLEDQDYILQQILRLCDTEQPDGVILAGDIYDKPVPPAGAVELFDRFLSALSDKVPAVFVISGNHDSAERLAFGGQLMRRSGVHIAPVFNGTVTPVTLTDDYGTLQVWMLPFIKPAHAAACYDDDIGSYTDAVDAAVRHMAIDPAQRHLLITHQFITGAATCDSEELSVGGTDNVDVRVFDPFDYVALGHLHAPQKVSRDTVRYAGSPLKYSFSEARHNKSVTLVTLAEKGNVTVRTIPLIPRRDMLELRGTYDELTARSFYDGTPYRDAYVRITLTDEDDIPDAVGKLRVIYPHILRLDYDNRRTRENAVLADMTDVEQRHPLALFEDFFETQNNAPMSDDQRALASRLIERLWEDDV